MDPLSTQVANLFAAALLLIAFAMLSQRRIVTLINLFAWQGLALVGSTATVVAYSPQSPPPKIGICLPSSENVESSDPSAL